MLVDIKILEFGLKCGEGEKFDCLTGEGLMLYWIDSCCTTLYCDGECLRQEKETRLFVWVNVCQLFYLLNFHFIFQFYRGLGGCLP